jgi:hypothetical protein
MRPTDRISAVLCAAVCAAVTAVTWLKATLSGCAALGFGLTARQPRGDAGSHADPGEQDQRRDYHATSVAAAFR